MQYSIISYSITTIFTYTLLTVSLYPTVDKLINIGTQQHSTGIRFLRQSHLSLDQSLGSPWKPDT